MFDKDVVYHTQDLEHTLDYIFSHLGLAHDKSIDYPLILTEAFCNPNYSRAQVSELLFECYKLPRVCYSVDFMLSLLFNATKTGLDPLKMNSLVVSSGFHTSHIAPLFDG